MPKSTSLKKHAFSKAGRRRTVSASHIGAAAGHFPLAGTRARALTYPYHAARAKSHDFAPEASSVASSPSRSALATPTTVRAADLDMSKAAKVISAAQKFILPIPALSDGEPLVYPSGTQDRDGNSIEGKPITDWEGKPIGETGVVFYNGKDRSVQAVKGDDTGVIIFNEATEEQARTLMGRVVELAGTPQALNQPAIQAVLATAGAIGLTDRYNSDRGFIQSKMTPMGNLGADCFGLYKRDDRDICLAVRLDGKGVFIGPAATPQIYDDGAVIVQQGNDFRLIQPREFERTYRLADNSPVNARTLPLGLGQ